MFPRQKIPAYTTYISYWRTTTKICGTIANSLILYSIFTNNKKSLSVLRAAPEHTLFLKLLINVTKRTELLRKPTHGNQTTGTNSHRLWRGFRFKVNSL